MSGGRCHLEKKDQGNTKSRQRLTFEEVIVATIASVDIVNREIGRRLCRRTGFRVLGQL